MKVILADCARKVLGDGANNTLECFTMFLQDNYSFQYDGMIGVSFAGLNWDLTIEDGTVIVTEIF